MHASKSMPKTTAVTALLQSRGACAERPVAAVTASPAVIRMLAGATAALGCPFFPLDPDLPEAIVAALLEQAGVQLVVGEGNWPGCVTLPAPEILAAPAAASLPSRHRLHDIALLIATSGSSGRPKAVMLSAGNLRAAALASAACTPLRPGDRWLACLPLFHIGGYSILHRCALAGAEAVLHEGFDAERLWRTLADERITHLSVVPTMLARLLDLAPAPPPATLRHVLVGGAALSPALAERAAEHGWPIQPTYGMSETASQIATLPALPRPWPPGLVGRPLPGIEAALAADGRLRVRGPMVMAGYANPRLAPGDGLEDGWFTTNDLAEIRADGQLQILGRADDIIVSGGKKFHPATVENRLAGCPGLGSAGVVGRPDPLWGEIVTVVFSGEVAADALLDWCRQHIAGASRPRAAIRVAALPTLTNGKPDRAALRRLARGNDAQSGTGSE
ncbi:MAG: AMP-binding protein [Rhodocyclaceae bacterium]|nr:AMP-binding protein [Rhodocyclaceae bacterium]